jgi:hypothetical protein
MLRPVLLCCAAAFPATADWDEHLFLEKAGSAWTLRWSAYKRGLLPGPCSSGHLDSAAAEWQGVASGDPESWTLASAPALWRGKRLGPRPAGALRGSVRLTGTRLRVDLQDGEGRPFRGNGSYDLKARTPDRVCARR